MSVFAQHSVPIYSVFLQQNCLQFKPQTLNQIALTDAAISMPEWTYTRLDDEVKALFENFYGRKQNVHAYPYIYLYTNSNAHFKLRFSLKLVKNNDLNNTN